MPAEDYLHPNGLLGWVARWSGDYTNDAPTLPSPSSAGYTGNGLLMKLSGNDDDKAGYSLPTLIFSPLSYTANSNSSEGDSFTGYSSSAGSNTRIAVPDVFSGDTILDRPVELMNEKSLQLSVHMGSDWVQHIAAKELTRRAAMRYLSDAPFQQTLDHYSDADNAAYGEPPPLTDMQPAATPTPADAGVLLSGDSEPSGLVGRMPDLEAPLSADRNSVELWDAADSTTEVETHRRAGEGSDINSASVDLAPSSAGVSNRVGVANDMRYSLPISPLTGLIDFSESRSPAGFNDGPGGDRPAGMGRSYIAQKGQGPLEIAYGLYPEEPFATMAYLAGTKQMSFDSDANRWVVIEGQSYSANLRDLSNDQIAKLNTWGRRAVSGEAAMDSFRNTLSDQIFSWDGVGSLIGSSDLGRAGNAIANISSTVYGNVAQALNVKREGSLPTLAEQLYVEPKFIANSYMEAVNGWMNTDNSWPVRVGYLAGASATLPMFAVEEFGRGFLNIPSALAGAPEQARQAGRSFGVAADGSQGDITRTIAVLNGVVNLTSSFNGFAGPAALATPRLNSLPILGMDASTALSEAGQYAGATLRDAGQSFAPMASAMIEKQILRRMGGIMYAVPPEEVPFGSVPNRVGNTTNSMAEHPNYVGELPFSYKEGPFQRFTQRFGDEFSAAGFDDAKGFMQGSAASGVKYSTGEALNAKIGALPADYDVAVVSPKLVQRALELGLKVFNGPLTASEVGALGLTDAQNALSAASKYQLPVNFMIYDSAEAVFGAQKTIPFSDWIK